MKSEHVCFITVAMFFIIVFPAHALYNKYGIPDSSEIRSSLVETWFEAPLDVIRMNRPEIHKSQSGKEFQVRLEESESSFSIFVAPHTTIAVDVYSDSGRQTIMQNMYPGDAIGSWVLVREKQTGLPMHIRCYFSPDSDIYVQFSPFGKKTSADFVIFGCYVARNIPIGLPFDRFYTASFADIIDWTQNTLPWKYAVIHPAMYHSTKQMIAVIREHLPDLVYADDTMYDENSEPVYVSTGKPRIIPIEDSGKLSLSSGGFVKWIADGLVEPLAGGCLKREPLIVSTVRCDPLGYQGVLSNSYNLSFALDWTRNIAAGVLSVETGKEYRYSESGVDVKIEPFSAEITATGVRNTVSYIPDNGYPVTVLKALLYVLASKDPTECYFAAIRETDRTKSPEVKVFNECAVLFPYFDDKGHFACAVFRNCAESEFSAFCQRYRSDFIHLVQVRTSDKFYPQ
jgi:hypothetical protein